MSAFDRVTSGLRATLTDSQVRDGYRARLQWLLQGSSHLPAWSLEYRAGLTGNYVVDAMRSNPDPTLVRSCPDGCRAHAPLHHLYEQRFVYQLSDTVANTVSAATLLCGTREPPFFVRESISWPFESIVGHGLDIPDPRKAALAPDGPTTIFPSTRNYYHWLIEELPMIVRAHTSEPDVTVLVNDEGLSDRHTLVASTLGIRVRSAPKTVRIRSHVMPGRASDSWFIHPADAQILFDLGHRLTSTTVDNAEKIYVSRRQATRSLPFEAEVESQLSDAGFMVVTPESLTWVEQITLFRSATTVIAPHGAGLSNLVFTPPGATLIELTNGHHYNRCFEWLCHIAGHTYIPIGADDGRYPTADALVREILTASAG